MHASMHLLNPSYGWSSYPFSSGVFFRIQQNLSLSLSHNHPLSDLATGPWERVGGAVEDGGLGPRSTFIENIWKKKKDPCPPPHSVSCVHHFRFLLSRIYFFLGFGLRALGFGWRFEDSVYQAFCSGIGYDKQQLYWAKWCDWYWTLDDVGLVSSLPACLFSSLFLLLLIFI